MEQLKIGKFIAECRKRENLTQMQLAEKLNITDRAVSKWETGKAMPDSSIMLDLCEILKITVNDLLSGEIIVMDNYREKTEELLLEMTSQKEQTDKKLLSLEILIGILSMIILLGFTFVASFFNMENWLRITFIIFGFLVALIGLVYALKIEQTAGYYECQKCKHRYVPTFSSVFLAMHINRTRYMKCPKCKQFSWQKKVISEKQDGR
ncbi:MAG: helix-turn-helix domain-containing protein [Clostridia bacterium]|nr:helix-turn-helix domain-containing protein [Clostridia bacterium]